MSSGSRSLGDNASNVAGRQTRRWASTQARQADRQSLASLIALVIGHPRPPPSAPISETAVIPRRASAPRRSTTMAKAVP